MTKLEASSEVVRREGSKLVFTEPVKHPALPFTIKETTFRPQLSCPLLHFKQCLRSQRLRDFPQMFAKKFGGFFPEDCSSSKRTLVLRPK